MTAKSAPAPEKSAPPRLSLVVLPFAANISGMATPSRTYFVDGVTESLTTRPLAHLRGLRHRPQHGLFLQRQIARTQTDRSRAQRALRARRQAVPAQRKPHARQRAAWSRPTPAASIWAERFDKPVADLLPDMQVTRSSPASPTGFKAGDRPRRGGARRALGEPGSDGPLFPWACAFQQSSWRTADLPQQGIALTSTAPSISIRRMSTRWSGARWSMWPL